MCPKLILNFWFSCFDLPSTEGMIKTSPHLAYFILLFWGNPKAQMVCPENNEKFKTKQVKLKHLNLSSCPKSLKTNSIFFNKKISFKNENFHNQKKESALVLLPKSETSHCIMLFSFIISKIFFVHVETCNLSTFFYIKFYLIY